MSCTQKLLMNFFIKYDKLNKLLKDFEPYRNLWVTTSDWLRWHDSWMNDPITLIDAENIEKNVTESYKAMHKAIKQFQEFESTFHLNIVQLQRTSYLVIT